MAPSIIYCIIAALCLTTVTTGVSVPICQTTAPTQQILSNITTANLTVGSPPFGLVYASKDIAFASLSKSLGVLNTSTFAPTLIREIPLAQLFPTTRFEPFAVSGLAISHDKRTVYASVGPGAVGVDVKKAVSGSPAVVGLLKGVSRTEAIEVTVSLDDEYVFVSQEYGNNLTDYRGAIEVFHVKQSSNETLLITDVGYIALDYLVVGSALSPDGKKLYVTSETIVEVNGTQGTLSILDVETLKTSPGKALLASADAGCGAVRVAPSHDGKHVWVTARESNALLAFDARKLESNSTNALVASVQVGTSPVGLIFANGGRQIITADSNRFDYTNTTTGLTVVDVHAALKGKQGFPSIPTGLFPREFAVSPDGKTLLASQYGSDAIQAVDLRQLAHI